MKKKFFAYMIIGILLFTFLAQGREQRHTGFRLQVRVKGKVAF